MKSYKAIFLNYFFGIILNYQGRITQPHTSFVKTPLNSIEALSTHQQNFRFYRLHLAQRKFRTAYWNMIGLFDD